MKKRALYSIMVLALVLGMAFAPTTPVGAATVIFTGDVEADFPGPGILTGILTIPDPGGVGDVGWPANAPSGTFSGWDIVDLRLTYDTGADTLYVGINTLGIAGDADGDGYPGGTSAWLATNGGTDVADLGSTETIAVYFDLDKDGTWDVIAGVSGWSDITGFTCANFQYLEPGHIFNPPFNFGTSLTGHIGSYYASPSAGAPDFEFTIMNFSTLPGSDSSVGGFIVGVFMGSLADDGIGEDFFTYEQNPHTITTIASSAATVVSGGTVDLTVTEANPIATHSVDLTDARVEVLKNGVPFATLDWPPDSGEAADLYVLDVGETWSWTISSGPITSTTTFVATGSGIAPGDFPVTYPGDPGERDDVTVNTMGPDTTTTITTSATTVLSGGSVNLTVTEENTGDDPLTNPYVLVNPGGYSLTKAPPYYDTGDTNGNGILDPTETWRWTNIPSGPITTATTFVALGFGTDSLGHEVSYAAGYSGERDDVTVNVKTMPPPVGWETYPINKLAVLAPWIALAAVIISGVSLLLLKRRRA